MSNFVLVIEYFYFERILRFFIMNDVKLNIAGFILIIFYSCSSDKKETSHNFVPTVKKATSASSTQPGEIIYIQFCLACHMENGEGVPGLYPPLVHSESALDDKKRLIEAVLHGKDGLIEVNGDQYNSVMAKLDYLGDKEIAEVLSYVRSNFGNITDTITINDVKTLRNAGVN